MRKTVRTDLYIRLAKEGLTIADIADKCGVTRQAVHSALRIAKEKGIDISYNKKIVPIDDDTKNAILELYGQYNSIENIANITGVSTTAVSKIVKDARERDLLDRPFKSRSNIHSAIVELINEGYKPKEISDKLDFPIIQVYNYIAKAKRANELINYDPKVDVRKYDRFYDDAVKLYNAGYTHKEMVEELDICNNTLCKILSMAEKNSDIVFRKNDKSKYYKFIELYNKGCSRREISKEINIKPSTASRYLSKVKKENSELLTRDKIKYHQDTIDKVIDLYNKGYKYKDIADELGLTISTVSYLMSEARLNQSESIIRSSVSHR
nr:MAG TPA: Putative ATPase subunit of terminase (gpP like) [Caudoviricetes sp.]